MSIGVVLKLFKSLLLNILKLLHLEQQCSVCFKLNQVSRMWPQGLSTTTSSVSGMGFQLFLNSAKMLNFKYFCSILRKERFQLKIQVQLLSLGRPFLGFYFVKFLFNASKTDIFIKKPQWQHLVILNSSHMPRRRKRFFRFIKLGCFIVNVPFSYVTNTLA